MSISAVNNQQDAVALQATTQKSTWKLGDPSSFAELFGSYAPAGPAAATPAAAQPQSTAAKTMLSTRRPVQPVVEPAVQAAAATGAPAVQTTAASLFTASYEQGAVVTGTDGSSASLNPMELATADTASEVAQMLGGTVVEDQLSGPYASSVPTREIQVPGSNVEINAGLAAGLFSEYGAAQGSQAWVTINRDLGRDPMSTGTLS